MNDNVELSQHDSSSFLENDVFTDAEVTDHDSIQSNQPVVPEGVFSSLK